MTQNTPVQGDGIPGERRSVVSRRSVLRKTGSAGGAVLAGLSTSPTGNAAPVRCEEVRIPVALAPGQSKEYEIAGTLCLPPNGQRKSVVQLLIHGITYARYYNDFPYRPETYSYRRRANAAGYPTLNIDRIGSGESSHPPPELITLDGNAYIVHQIAQALRDGRIGDTAFSEVMYVGHSYGSGTSLKSQADYGGADYLVLTGFTAQQGRFELTTVIPRTGWIPALLSDHEDINDLPPGYLTTVEGFRDGFYYAPNADPEVIAVDERNKQTLTETEAATWIKTYYAGMPLNPSLSIEVPVLEVLGDQDTIFCGVRPCSALAEEEDTEHLLWPNADFTMEVIPGSGHDIFLQRNAPSAFTTILDWADRVGGTRRERPRNGPVDGMGGLL